MICHDTARLANAGKHLVLKQYAISPYESIDAALKAAKVWCNGQGLSCKIKDRGIGVEVLAENGTWRTVCYPSNCLEPLIA